MDSQKGIIDLSKALSLSCTWKNWVEGEEQCAYLKKELKKLNTPPKEKKEKDPNAPKVVRLSKDKKILKIQELSKELREIEEYGTDQSMNIHKQILKL